MVATYVAGCDVQVYSDEQSNFQGLFFQDKIIKEVFKAYPELIFVDATYKLLAKSWFSNISYPI